jgi:Protein of unknown function (DUF992)
MHLNKRRNYLYSGLAVMFGLLASHAAMAETAKLKVGTLTCHGKGGVGLILGSQEQLSCKYTPADNRPPSHLAGKITRIGLDIGVRGKSVMVWAVLGSTTKLPAEALGGKFAGASADIAAGIGAGANILIGGNNKSVVLQPLSVKGQTGVNLALGVAGLTLTPIAR